MDNQGKSSEFKRLGESQDLWDAGFKARSTIPLSLEPDRPRPRLYDRMIAELRGRHYSPRTEQSYCY